MIVVRVELHSAVTGKMTELARMEIVNDNTGGLRRRHYDVRTLFGRNHDALSRRRTQREGKVCNWPSTTTHVWNLVQTALTNMGYGAKP